MEPLGHFIKLAEPHFLNSASWNIYFFKKCLATSYIKNFSEMDQSVMERLYKNMNVASNFKYTIYG